MSWPPVEESGFVHQGSRQQLPDEAAGYVREQIMSGNFRPGDFLRMGPIAEAVGMSITPVREGLLALAAEGYVRAIPRRGFVVAEFTRRDIQDLFWTQAKLAGGASLPSARRPSRRFGTTCAIAREHRQSPAPALLRLARVSCRHGVDRSRDLARGAEGAGSRTGAPGDGAAYRGERRCRDRDARGTRALGREGVMMVRDGSLHCAARRARSDRERLAKGCRMPYAPTVGAGDSASQYNIFDEESSNPRIRRSRSAGSAQCLTRRRAG